MAASPPAAGVAGAGPVVICCAAEDAAELEEVVRALADQGSAVELVSDAASDPRALEPVVARFAGAGIYVLCRSEGLSRAAIDNLREILLAHRVPFGRTLTVTSIRAHELVDRIRRALRRTAGGVSTGKPAPRRTMLGLPVPSPAPAPAVPTPVERDDSRPTDVGRGEEDTITDATPSQEDTVAGARALGEERPAKTTGPIEFDELTTLEVPHAWIEEEERAHTESQAELADAHVPSGSPPPPPPSRRQPSPPEDSLANAPLITAEDLADLATESGPIQVESEQPQVGTPRSPSRVMITGDTVIARLVGDAGHSPTALGVTERVPALPVRESAPATTPVPSRDDPPVVPSSPPSAKEGGRMGLWLGLGGLAVVVGLAGAGWAFTRDRGGGTETAKAEERPLEESPPSEEEAEEPEEERIPDATLPGQLETAVMVALRNRELRALDVLLVANEDGPALPYEDAETYCRTFEAAGIMEWRLPEVGELASMTEAGMVGRAIYWSRTPADTFGDSRFAWHGRLKRVLRRDAASRVLCVRGEHVAP